ncbi:hypothetical protein H6G76_34125 [Nostoc sp. FACHB-152]|uniref:hypothetical protein n=1 Tax=unclassified Nostoc TaxID=2593658 RepID=UPI0016883E10|nr:MULTISPECIES: hypothetical protein [unclassified Nostoc]MBD2452065.1 hypothetical protein [Nostoc sp. FACHB-152]MBD2472634.1 hypothetical protein [Nostoc sp. FACHB-145]
MMRKNDRAIAYSVGWVERQRKPTNSTTKINAAIGVGLRHNLDLPCCCQSLVCASTQPTR